MTNDPAVLCINKFLACPFLALDGQNCILNIKQENFCSHEIRKIRKLVRVKIFERKKKKVSRYYEMVSRLFEKAPRYFEKLSRYYERVPRYYELYRFWSCRNATRSRVKR